MRLIRSAGWNSLPPRIPADRALIPQRLSTSDSEFFDILTNHTFDGKVGGVTYAPIPFRRLYGGMRGVRVTALYATSHPEERLVNFGNRSPIRRCIRIPSFNGGCLPYDGLRCAPREDASWTHRASTRGKFRCNVRSPPPWPSASTSPTGGFSRKYKTNMRINKLAK